MYNIKSYISYLNEKIIGISDSIPMERRFFSIATFYSAMLCLLAIIVNYLTNIVWYLQVITFSAFLLCSTLYLISRFRPGKENHVWIFVISGVIILSFAWFVNAGHDGPVSYLFIILLIACLMILGSKRRTLLVLIFMVDLSALFWVHYKRPEIVIGYNSLNERIADNYFTVFYSIILIYGFVVYILNNYKEAREKADAEKFKTEAANMELVKKNIRIKDQNDELEKLNNQLNDKNIQIYNQYMKLEELIAQLTEKNVYISRKNEELNALNNELVDINTQLDMLNQELTEANATKHKFFSLISHDLKNPLAAVSNYTELFKLANKMPPSQIKELAASMEKSVNFVLDLLDNILVWSMSQSDRIEFNPETINFSKYISHYIPNFESVAQVKDITFSCEIDKDYKIRADKNMLHTIIRNLVSNAVKFTDKGGSIAVSIKEEGNSLVRIAVTDTGIGMNETDLVKLFKPDTHYATIGSSREKGTGLGLILCKEFVERNGGRIWAESKPGEGSRFLFTLPRAN